MTTRTSYNGKKVDGVGAAGSNIGFEYHFCTTCGSTLSWTMEDAPSFVAIAVGNFVDPDFPTPTTELHTTIRHAWVPPIPDAAQYEAFRS